MKRLILAILLAPALALAAKTPVEWTAPVTNTDGSPLTDLDHYRLAWKACGSASVQSVTTKDRKYTVVTSGIAKLCINVYAVNTLGVESPPSSTLVVNVTTLGKPTTLGQPVTLP